MPRPSNVELIARVRELEATQGKAAVQLRVKALLKEAVRRPDHAARLAQEALDLIE